MHTKMLAHQGATGTKVMKLMLTMMVKCWNVLPGWCYQYIGCRFGGEGIEEGDIGD